MQSKFKLYNIRELLRVTNGEAKTKSLLAMFSCAKNKEVEKFAREQAIEFTKKNQSVTYIVLSNDETELLGYFALAIKPISVHRDAIPSKTTLRKIARVSELVDEGESYLLSAYLIAQLGKNDGAGVLGAELLEIAYEVLKDIQFKIGGMVTFIEVEDNKKLLKFYSENDFKQFDVRMSKNDSELVQMLKILPPTPEK